MGSQPFKRDDESLGMLDPTITRRDFVGGALLGTGAALLGMAAPELLRAAEADRSRRYPTLGPDWTGPGGIGDYSRSNGNTHEVVNDAHSIYQGRWNKPPADAIDAGVFDLVVVGGGFATLCKLSPGEYDYEVQLVGAPRPLLGKLVVGGAP